MDPVEPPPPPAPDQPEPWGPWATFWLGVLVFVIFTAAQTVSFFVSYFSIAPEETSMEEFASDGDTLGILTLVAGTACIALILLLVRLRGFPPRHYLALIPNPKWLPLILWVLLTAAIALLHSWAAPFFGRDETPEFMIKAYHSTDALWLLALAIVAMAPLFEEIFFRGFLYAGWMNSRLGFGGTALLTALFWTIIHVQYGWYEWLFIFGLGLLLAVARRQSGSLWTPLAMHAFNNALALVLTGVELASG